MAKAQSTEKSITKRTKREKRDYTKLKQSAESLFLSQELSSREIADIIGVSEVTISKWRREQMWDEKRSFIKTTPARLRMVLLREAERVAGGEESTIKADTIVKLLSGADKLASRVTVDVVFEVLSECVQHISTIDNDFAVKMAEYHKIFLQHKMQE